MSKTLRRSEALRNVNARIPAGMVRWLDSLVKLRGERWVTRSDLIRDALVEYRSGIERHQDPERARKAAGEVA